MRSTTLAFWLSATALLTPQVSVSASYHSITKCEGETVNLSCKDGHEMSVTKALYGRYNKYVCSTDIPDIQVTDSNCGATDEYAAKTLAFIQEKCDKKTLCSIVAKHGFFGQDDPCEGFFKYLKVDYRCTVKPFMFVESYTCNRYTAIHDEIAIAGSPIYTDDTTYTLGDTAGLYTALGNEDKTNTLKKQELKLIQTPLADKVSNPQSALASFRCLKEVQYILAIPPGKQPAWLELHGWVLMKDATISVNHPGDDAIAFTCWTKLYMSKLTSVIGPNDGSRDLMMFVLYKELSFAKPNNGAISNIGEDALIVAKCKVNGQSDFTGFNKGHVTGGVRNYLAKSLAKSAVKSGIFTPAWEHKNEKWLPMLTAKDCAFQLQTYSRSGKSRVEKTAVRLNKDLWLYDHVENEMVYEYIDPSSGSTYNIGKKFGIHRIENKDLGIKVALIAGGGGVRIELSSMYYQMNVNGICQVPSKAHPYALKADSDASICGHDAGRFRQFKAVRRNMVLWYKKETWKARMENSATKESSFCLRHYCDNPKYKVKWDELPIPTNLQCPHSLTKCEGETANLSCKDGHEMSVTKATYGRTNVDTCAAGRPKNHVSNTNCGATDEYAAHTLDVIQGICAKKASCSIVAATASFKEKDPCYGTIKYLIVDFQCTEILTEATTSLTASTCNPSYDECDRNLKEEKMKDMIVDVVTPQEIASTTCPALPEACHLKSPEHIKKVLRDILKIVEKQPWQNSCIMLSDYCTAGIKPQMGTENPSESDDYPEIEP